jgi:hypothetical protein
MMSIGMHCRLLGRPGRMRALQRFLDHVQRHDRVWVTRRIDIARHWKQVHPVRRRDRLRLGVQPTMALTLEQLNAARGRVHRAAGRHLRTLALDRRAGLAQRPFARWRT